MVIFDGLMVNLSILLGLSGVLSHHSSNKVLKQIGANIKAKSWENHDLNQGTWWICPLFSPIFPGPKYPFLVVHPSPAPSAHRAEARHHRCWACDASETRLKLCHTAWMVGKWGLRAHHSLYCQILSDLWYLHSE